MAIAPLLVQIRTAGAAAIGRAVGQLNRTARAAQNLQRSWRAHTRAVSSVAGAYQDANGMWRTADGRLLTQRHRVTQVTTAYGRLVQRIQRATSAMGRFGRVAGRIGSVVGRVGAAAAPYAVLAAKILLAVSAVLALTGALGNLLGLTQLIAPSIIAGVAAFATLKMATAGFGDAVKAGLSGDTEAFSEALKKLSPNARSAAGTLVDLAREWKRTQRAVQDRFFLGFRDDAIAVSRAVQPVADKWLPQVARAFAEVRTTLRSVFVEAAKSGQLDTIMQGVTRGINGLLGALPAVARALFDVAEVASGTFGDMGAGIQSAAQKFADWIRQAKESGKLKEWLDKAIEAFQSLKAIVGNVGEMLGALFRGASDQGQSFLEKVEELTQRMADWLNSSDGQELIDTLASIVGWVIACKPAFETMATVMGAVFWVITNAWTGIKQVASAVVNYILGAYSWLLEGAARAFSWIPGLGPKLRQASEWFNDLKIKANNAINGIQDTVNITVNYRARKIGDHMARGGELSGTYQGGGGRAQGGPMRAGLTYRINENGDEFIQLGKSGRAYNARESAGMFSGGGVAQLVAAGGPRSSSDFFLRVVEEGIRRGRLKLKVSPTSRSVTVG